MKIETTLTVSLSQLKTAKKVVAFFEGFYGDTYDAVLLLNHLVDETPDTFSFQGKEVMVKYENVDNEDNEKTALREEYETLKKNFDILCEHLCERFECCDECPLFNKFCYKDWGK